MAGDPTNGWAADHAAAEAMLRSAEMRATGYPLDETYSASQTLTAFPSSRLGIATSFYRPPDSAGSTGKSHAPFAGRF